MKKLVSLIMVLALVLGLATVAFAADATPLEVTGNSTDGWVCTYYAPGTYTVTLPDGCDSVYMQYGNFGPGGPAGCAVKVTSSAGYNFTVQYGNPMQMGPNPGGFVEFTLEMSAGYAFQLNGAAGDVFTVVIEEPKVGTYATMDDVTIDDLWYTGNENSQITQIDWNKFEFAVTPPADKIYVGEYYYGLSTAYTSYYMTISDVEAVVLPGQAVADAELKWSVSLNTDYGYADVTSDEPEETSATVGFPYAGYYALCVSAGQYDKTTGELVGPAAVKFNLTYDYPEVFSELHPKYVEIMETPEFFQTVSIPASKLEGTNYYSLEYYYYELSIFNEMGAQISIADPDVVIKYAGEFYTAANDHDDNDQVLTVNLAYDSSWFPIGIANVNAAAKRFVVNVDLLEGYINKPADLALGQNKVSFDADYGYYYNMYYFYTWTAQEDGVLTLSDLKAVLPEDAAESYYEGATPVAELNLFLNLDMDKVNNDPEYEIPLVEGNSVEVAKGDVVTVYLTVAYDEEAWQHLPADVTFNAGFLPANPIEVNSAAALNGIELGAGETKYYAINGKLNGQILTINGDANTVVTLNGKELTAVNGVFTAELTGTPVNALIVTNKGAEAASYTAGIGFALGTAGNPISVTTEQGVGGKIDAGAEVHYLLNSKLSGAVLSVQGEGAYVIVDGVKTEAKDGVIKLTLNAKNPTISLVIGNTGSAAASVVLAFSDNPPTGDLSILAPAAALLVSAMSTVALVIKKKEF